MPPTVPAMSTRGAARSSGPCLAPDALDDGADDRAPAAVVRPRPTPARADEGSPVRARWLAAAALVVVALVAGAAIGARFRTGSEPERLSEETGLDGGQVRFSTDVGPSTLEVTGPATVEVGEEAVVVADGDGIVQTTWVSPTGEVFEDQARLAVTPNSAGTATIVAVGRDEAGRQLVVEYRLQVDG